MFIGANMKPVSFQLMPHFIINGWRLNVPALVDWCNFNYQSSSRRRVHWPVLNRCQFQHTHTSGGTFIQIHMLVEWSVFTLVFMQKCSSNVCETAHHPAFLCFGTAVIDFALPAMVNNVRHAWFVPSYSFHYSYAPFNFSQKPLVHAPKCIRARHLNGFFPRASAAPAR